MLQKPDLTPVAVSHLEHGDLINPLLTLQFANFCLISFSKGLTVAIIKYLKHWSNEDQKIIRKDLPEITLDNSSW